MTSLNESPFTKLRNTAGDEEISRIARILSRAFWNDPLFTYFVPEPETRLGKLSRIFQFVAMGGLKYGELLAGSDSSPCAAILLPSGEVDMTLAQQLACGGLDLLFGAGIGVIRRLTRFGDFSSALQRRLMPEKHRYLQVLGVEPELQGRGLGVGLLQEILRRAGDEGHPVYLEIENADNLSFYSNRGFRVLEETRLPGTGIPVWALGWRR